jgi:hypothetical protein
MTADELIAYRQRLGLSTWKMAALLGADHRRYRRWEGGQLEKIGLYVDILLPLIIKIRENPAYEALIDDAFIGTTWVAARESAT